MISKETHSLADKMQAQSSLPPVEVPTHLHRFSQSHVINPILSIDMLRSYDNYSDEELLPALEKSLSNVMTQEYVSILFNERLLTLLNTAISNISFNNRINTDDVLSEIGKAVWCRECYIHMTSTNPYLTTILLEITCKVFYRQVMRLRGIGLTDKLSSIIIISRRSSMLDSINVKRVNYVLMTATEQVVQSVQNIVYIYETIFDNLTPLVTYTIFDFHELDIYNNCGSMSRIYDMQNIAVLEILNAQSTGKIESVLRNVSSEFLAHPYDQIRFSPLSISGDYFRVRDVAEYLESNGIYMPR